MVKVSKEKAVKQKSKHLALDLEDRELADALLEQITEFHSLNRVPQDKEIEELLLRQKQLEINRIGVSTETQLPKFSPSGASKCDLELYRIANKQQVPELKTQPYHVRQTRNASAAHEATQRDLLYMEKVLDNPRFTVMRNELGLPMWESNLYKQLELNHRGQKFILSGMCDGILIDSTTGEQVIFEYKTKSTTIAAVGDYKMKGIADYHKLQGVCYSIMFCGDPYEDRDDKEIFLYESMAKDFWTKGEDARLDIRTFQQSITLQDRMAVLDRFADIVAMTEEPEHTDCDVFFCPLK